VDPNKRDKNGVVLTASQQRQMAKQKGRKSKRPRRAVIAMSVLAAAAVMAILIAILVAKRKRDTAKTQATTHSSYLNPMAEMGERYLSTGCSESEYGAMPASVTCMPVQSSMRGVKPPTIYDNSVLTDTKAMPDTLPSCRLLHAASLPPVVMNWMSRVTLGF
jgi:hypothetical protein